MSTTASGTVGSDQLRFDYMNLLITQLRNQNPLEPMNNSEMSSQLAQIAQLEQLEHINGTFERVLAATQVSQAATLVGKDVAFYSTTDGAVLTGRVDEVAFEDGEAFLIVGSYAIGIEDVLSVGAPKEAPVEG